MKLANDKISFIAYDNDVDAWVPEIWAQEALAILEEEMVIGNLIHRDFSDEVRDFGDVVNTRRPSEYVAKRKGANDDVTIQATTATNVAVELNQHIHTSFQIRDSEQSLSFEDLVRVHIRPAALSIARKIDRILMTQAYQFLGNAVSDLESLDISNVKRMLLELGQKMDENKAFTEGRNLIVSPSTKTSILELDLFNSAEKRGDAGTALRRASLGEILGFDVMMAQNTPSILSVQLDAEQADELSADVLAGAVILPVDSGAGFIVGEYITVEGDLQPLKIIDIDTNDLTVNRAVRRDLLATASNIQPTATGLVDLAGHVGVTAYPVGYDKEIRVDGTGVPHVGQLISFSTDGTPNVNLSPEYGIIDVESQGGGAYHIELDRPLETAITDNDIVGYGHAGSYNFAFHRNALAMVIRPLAPPRAGTGASSGVADFNGLAMRVTITYNGVGQGHLVTLDVLMGVKVLDTDLGAVFLG